MQDNILDREILSCFNSKVEIISEKLKAEVLLYTGPIIFDAVPILRDIIEKCKKENNKQKKLAFILTTLGGSVEATAKIVSIIRHHYSDISFFVPETAMSAGTVLCLSGDNICMDYYSSLGPVDPQVIKGTQFVPALGYLDQFETFIEKSKKGIISPVEYAMLKDMDLAMLKLYEQARNLTIQLIKEWLVRYKFKSWKIHQTTQKGKPVTLAEKQERAEKIAQQLNDYKIWLSHGRRIDLDTLVKELKLKIDNYTNKEEWLLIREYNTAVSTYATRIGKSVFIQSKTGWGAI